MTARERPASDEPVPEPIWLVAANVVRWRRYGDGGQEFRPGTKAYRGGTKVYVVSTYGGMAHEDVSTIGRGRGSGRWITIDTGSRHLHTFRAQLVYTPAVLRRARGFCTPPPAREEAEELAALLERLAAAYRDSHYRTSHPTPCLCHTCLVTPE
ncbi:MULTISPECIES: hypothetical protein [Streptomyces]|uniref:hypothetical protein n=1 Tax=Streptomyces TaxID=1883 RepID=UPI00067C18DC|nr:MULTISPECIES: hypothetical protein [Streptomyces]KOG77615.1 hypothetical protein ADK33_29860 [Streptomyces griseus subsp. rhodochrous]